MSQFVYISLDDSGKLNDNEKYTVYAGLIFTDKKILDGFKNKYKKIIREIKKKEAYNDIDELKGYTLLEKDRKRILKFLNSYKTIGLVIKNKEIEKQDILINKNSKVRYRDFALKLTIKELFLKLIKSGEIDPTKPIRLIINMDQETTKTNGIYPLGDGIYEEFVKGITNFNYSFKTNPILFNKFIVEVHLQNSKESLVVQGADIIANSIWRNHMQSGEDKYVDFIKYFP